MVHFYTKLPLFFNSYKCCESCLVSMRCLKIDLRENPTYYRIVILQPCLKYKSVLEAKKRSKEPQIFGTCTVLGDDQ